MIRGYTKYLRKPSPEHPDLFSFGYVTTWRSELVFLSCKPPKTRTMNIDTFKRSFAERLNSRKNYDLFGNDNHEDIHWGKLFMHLFGEYFSRYFLRHHFLYQPLTNSLIRRYSLGQSQIIRIERSKENDLHNTDDDCSETLLILKHGFMVGITCNRVDLMYGPDITAAERTRVISIVEEFRASGPALKKFHMIERSMGYFDLTDFDIKPFDIDISTHYNDDFKEIHDLIIRSLTTKNKNGLILLHGKYGSGKTFYLRHLISKVERKFIYFPLEMIESLSSPEFLPFISKQPNSVLILEDCESLLVPRENGFSNASALSNLLNLGDGLLSDALSVNVICTFNAGIRKIDDAILRKGRLLARYEFKELETAKARDLAGKIGKGGNIDRPMTVSEVYNMDDKSFENPPQKSVGFSAA